MGMKVRATLAGLMALIGAVTFSSSASAATSNLWYYTTDSNPGGKARWIDSGDYIEICDVEADGWGAIAFLSRNSDGLELMSGFTQAGNGTCTTVSKNISETVELELMVCLHKNAGTTYNSCSIQFVRWN